MTSAPPNLLAVRRLLLDHLDIHENSSAYSTDLDPAEVGIVGDAAHIGEGDSYHLGVPEQDRSGSYSVLESDRDRAGLSVYASALDVGDFQITVAGKTHNLPTFSLWCVAQCQANASDTRDIREIIYSPDGQVVRRWDRLRQRTSGDTSHRGHTHFSFFRDSSGRDLTPLFRRYLTSIGLIEAPIVEAPDMDATQARQLAEVHAALLNPDQGMNKRTLAQLVKDLAYVLIQGPAGSSAWIGGALTRIAEASGIDAAELAQITAAARAGAVSAADQLVAAVLSKLPADQLTPAAVEQAVRDAFAGGLALAAPQG